MKALTVLLITGLPARSAEMTSMSGLVPGGDSPAQRMKPLLPMGPAGHDRTGASPLRGHLLGSPQGPETAAFTLGAAGP